MDLFLRNKSALVMASSRGLGYSCAVALAKENCDVVICSRNQDAVNLAVEKIRGLSKARVLGLAVNLGKEKEIDRLITFTRKGIGNPDILVTNTGGPPVGSSLEVDEEMYRKWFDIGVLRTMQIIKNCIPSMKEKKWGRIISITSMTVKNPVQNLVLSNVFRAGLTSFLKTIATDVARCGITVNSLLPGMHATDRLLEVGKKIDNFIDKVSGKIPAGKTGDPSDFGAIAAFLASKQASFITGQNLLIDGGQYGGY